MPLYDYLQQTQRFLREAKQELESPEDLIAYVNRARREVAMQAQCIRVLTPISGQIQSLTITNPGAHYTNPVLTIGPPDFPGGQPFAPSGAQATGSLVQTGGAITSAFVTYGGNGYFQPTLTITDGAGSGATLSAVIPGLNLLQQGQEVYPFSAINMSAFPGVGTIFAVRSVSVIYSNYRYSLPMYSFSAYQAYIRQYPFQYQYVPTFCSQFGQGINGSLYVYPIPSQTYQWEWDCLCFPQDMSDDQSVEILPLPWSEAVPYFAAHLAYAELQNLNFSKAYFEMFDRMMMRYSRAARPGRMVNPYGRY